MKYDAVVIGGGLLGLFTALEMLRRGYRVAIAEKETLCSGPCSRSTGIMMRQLVLRADIIFADRSIKIVRELEKSHGKIYFKKKGVLTINSRGRVVNRLEAIYRSIGVNYKLLDPYEIRNIWNILKVRDSEVGIYTEDDGILDIGSISYGLRKEIEDLGGSIYETCGDIYLKPDGNRVEKTISVKSSCEVYGEIFILNVGVNTSQVYMKSFGERLSPQQIFLLCQSLAIELGLGDDIPVIYDNVSHLYIVPETFKRAIIGDGPCEFLESPDNVSPSRSLLDKVLDDFIDRVKGADSARPIALISGSCDLTQDHLPFLGRDSRYRNLFLAYGLSTYGTMRSPYLGIQLARLAMGDNVDPEIRVLSLRSTRSIEGCGEIHTPIMYSAYSPSHNF
jgi:glycine/D-amino acid oxidase-like deaminating enzyme